ncbi:MAG: hypothetical protein HZA82_06885 [Thaumarchaeota archaeon]|nr:hypothetical protein [Nitrososphaerota archaeon]
MPHLNDSSKSIVVSAIEEVLNEFGSTTFETVVARLYQKHRCLLTDCYKKPQYLQEVLEELYGRCHIVILESIKKYLEKDLSNASVLEYHGIISSMLK